MLESVSDIKDYYSVNNMAYNYVRDRFACELNRLLHDRQVAAVQRLIDEASPNRVLEIAPGPGRLTRDIRPAGTLVCLEYNDGMIRTGRPTGPGGAAWVRGDGFHLPLAPQAFDLVYSFRFVRHFRRGDRERLYAEIRRVLRPGGRLVMDAVNERVARPIRDSDPAGYPVHDELYRLDVLRTELAGAGFELLRAEPVQKFYRWQYRSQVVLGPRADWLNRMVIRGLERLPARDGLEWVIICRG